MGPELFHPERMRTGTMRRARGAASNGAGDSEFLKVPPA